MYFIRQLFCKHDWELILERKENWYSYKTYRCKKCGKSCMYKCG